jgi:hypothetical protein
MHVEIDYYFIRENYLKGKINLQFVHGKDQIADIFTKALPKLLMKNLYLN